jgi:hypothetical protein
MIYAWDYYPISQFPGLWEWMASQVENKNLVMPNIAVQEVTKNSPECSKWLIDNHLELLDMSNSIIAEAFRIKKLLGIVDDQYHPKGVGENDLFIIATAKIYSAELVTDEACQYDLPANFAKRKIPTVCNMQEVSVNWINFIDFIKRSKAIFR